MAIYRITPVPAPRMTRADKWKKRGCVLRYRAFRDLVKLNGVTIPEHGADIVFHLPMPGGWSLTKINVHKGQPHQQKPDLDNLLKALLDAVFADDCRIWSYRAEKRWAMAGAIEIG